MDKKKDIKRNRKKVDEKGASKKANYDSHTDGKWEAYGPDRHLPRP